MEPRLPGQAHHGRAVTFQRYWYPDSRALLQSHLDGGAIRLILSGHLHESRDRTIAGVRHFWAPGVAFVNDVARDTPPGRGRRRVGFTMLGIRSAVEAVVHEPSAMMNVDIGSWLTHGIGHYAEFAGERPYLGLR